MRDDNMTLDHEIARGIKENYCKFSPDYDGLIKGIREGYVTKERKYKLPGTHRDIILETETLIGVPETLFQPQPNKLDSLHKSLNESVLRCDPEIRSTLMSNIVLAGGSSMIEGFKERTKKEVGSISSTMVTPDVIGPADRKFSAWLGGSLIANISSFSPLWVTHD